MSSNRGSVAERFRTESDNSERILNLVPSRGTERDWRFSDALEAGEVSVSRALPDSVDRREDWWAIGDQEDTGSCVGWATADGVLRYTLVKANRIPENGRVSPRHIWMASKETDEFDQRPETFIEGSGTSLRAAMEIARKYGVVDEADLPFHLATKMYVGNENVFYARAAQRRIRYYNLALNLDNWKEWLADTGPILAGFNVDDAWMNATDTNGVVDDFNPNNIRGGHAITIVGYRKDGYFIVRNSWGTSWGDNGFAYVSPAYIHAAFYHESYGAQL